MEVPLLPDHPVVFVLDDDPALLQVLSPLALAVNAGLEVHSSANEFFESFRFAGDGLGWAMAAVWRQAPKHDAGTGPGVSGGWAHRVAGPAKRCR